MIKGRAVPILLWALVAAAPLHAQAQSQARDFMMRLPEVVEPTPHGSVRMRTDGTKVNLVVDPDDLVQGLSVQLSEACSRMEFNQAKQGRFFTLINVPGVGIQRFGYAQGDGLNLTDLRNLGEEGIAYFFDLDGTSECRVYTYRLP